MVSYYGNSAHARSKLFMYFLLGDKSTSQCLAFMSCIVLGNPKDNYDMSASVFVVQFNGFMSLTSYFDVKYIY